MTKRPLEKYLKSEEDIILNKDKESNPIDIINKTLCKINSKIKKTGKRRKLCL